MDAVRGKIIATYAEWTVLSALRSGSPIKSRRDVYKVLRGVDFSVLFDGKLGPISRAAFDEWHERTVRQMTRREPRLSTGWAAKMVNVYLKTRAYIGSQGRHHLTEMIHPPIDAGLWTGLARRFSGSPEILEETHCVTRIRHIDNYRRYRRIVNGCRAAAKELGCKLIEVEQLWAGTEF